MFGKGGLGGVGEALGGADLGQALKGVGGPGGGLPGLPGGQKLPPGFANFSKKK